MIAATSAPGAEGNTHMTENKTKQTESSVEQFLSEIEDAQKQADTRAICQMMQDITGETPKMWGGSIIGFGSYHYKYATGREGDAPITGLSPRKQALTLYVGIAGATGFTELLSKLGKYTTGKGCLYIKRLSDVDTPTLKKLIAASFKRVKEDQHV